MKVHQLMSERVATIGESETCCDAAQRMASRRVRHLPVVNAAGRLIGVVTDRDLRHLLFEPTVFRAVGTVAVDRLLKRVPVRDVMSSPVVSVGPDDELEEAARTMLEDKIGCLPVVKDGLVVGIITETDLLHRILGADTACGEGAAIIVSFP
jgi:acetoin utilization protein AcuB